MPRWCLWENGLAKQVRALIEVYPILHLCQQHDYSAPCRSAAECFVASSLTQVKIQWLRSMIPRKSSHAVLPSYLTLSDHALWTALRRVAVNLGEAGEHLKEAAEKDVKDFMQVGRRVFCIVRPKALPCAEPIPLSRPAFDM